MNIIPVIDLLEHHVVHAKRGERQHYRPIESGLCNSSKPLAITQALLELYPFDTLYIADLNAIQGKPAHIDEIALIRQHYPQLHIWLDAGFNNTRDLLPWSGLGVTPVIGSESLPDINAYQELINGGVAHHVLSLDFRGDQYQGPEALLNTPQVWPEHLIGMTLAHVGSNAGPDHARLQQLASMRHGKLYSAGGVRDIGDLQRLQQDGITGALVASALHSGQISSQDIARISQ
ncbi:nickel transporter [Methylovorus mays]|nr:nickel transporter [Methylovorus mays]